VIPKTERKSYNTLQHVKHSYSQASAIQIGSRQSAKGEDTGQLRRGQALLHARVNLVQIIHDDNKDERCYNHRVDKSSDDVADKMSIVENAGDANPHRQHQHEHRRTDHQLAQPALGHEHGSPGQIHHDEESNLSRRRNMAGRKAKMTINSLVIFCASFIIHNVRVSIVCRGPSLAQTSVTIVRPVAPKHQLGEVSETVHEEEGNEAGKAQPNDVVGCQMIK